MSFNCLTHGRERVGTFLWLRLVFVRLTWGGKSLRNFCFRLVFFHLANYDKTMKLKLASGILAAAVVLTGTIERAAALPDRPDMGPPPQGRGMGGGPGGPQDRGPMGGGPGGKGLRPGPGGMKDALPPMEEGDSEPAPAPVPTLADPSNPYAAILARNVFRLVPVPPPPAVTNKTDEPLIGTLRMTGLLRFPGKPYKVLFVDTPKDPKAEATYYTLSEGEKEGQLEVVKLMQDKEAAEVIHAGTRLTLYLKDSKVTNVPPANAVGPGGVPPQPGMAGGGAVAMGGGGGGGSVAIGGGMPVSAPSGGGGQQIPTRALRAGGPTGTTVVPPTTSGAAPQTAAESAARLLLNSQSGGNMPPMPPMPGSTPPMPGQ